MLQQGMLETAADATDVCTSAGRRIGWLISVAPAIRQVAVPRNADQIPSVPMQTPKLLLRQELERQNGQVQGQSCRPCGYALPLPGESHDPQAL